MKKIEAIIEPSGFTKVKEALRAIGLPDMTVTETKSFGQPNGHTEYYRGAVYQIDFVPEIKIEIVVDNGMVAKAVEAIRRNAQVDRRREGKIFVSNIDEAIDA